MYGHLIRITLEPGAYIGLQQVLASLGSEQFVA